MKNDVLKESDYTSIYSFLGAHGIHVEADSHKKEVKISRDSIIESIKNLDEPQVYWEVIKMLNDRFSKQWGVKFIQQKMNEDYMWIEAKELKTSKLAKVIIKQADFVNNLSRVLKMELDDKFIDQGMRVKKVLDTLENQAPTILEKNQIADIKGMIDNAMKELQDAQEALFNLQQQLINEETNVSLLDKE